MLALKELFKSQYRLDVENLIKYYKKEFKCLEICENLVSFELFENFLLNNRFNSPPIQLTSKNNIFLANLLIVDLSNTQINLGFKSNSNLDEDPRFLSNGYSHFFDSLYKFKKRGGNLKIVYDKKTDKLEQILELADEKIEQKNPTYKVIPFTVGDNAYWIEYNLVESFFSLSDGEISSLEKNYFGHKF